MGSDDNFVKSYQSRNYPEVTQSSSVQTLVSGRIKNLYVSKIRELQIEYHKLNPRRVFVSLTIFKLLSDLSHPYRTNLHPFQTRAKGLLLLLHYQNFRDTVSPLFYGD